MGGKVPKSKVMAGQLMNWGWLAVESRVSFLCGSDTLGFHQVLSIGNTAIEAKSFRRREK